MQNTKNMKILAICHQWPNPNTTAAAIHFIDLLRFFKERFGAVIHGVSIAKKIDAHDHLDPFLNTITQLGLNDTTFQDYLLRNSGFDIVLFDRFITYEQFAWQVTDHIPKALKILDTEDLHFLRKDRQKKQRSTTNSNDTKEIPISELAKRELACIFKADLSLIISKFEYQLLINEYQVPKEQLLYLPLLSNNNDFCVENLPKYDARKDLIFVGNFLHDPNADAVMLLKKHIWPKLSKKMPNVSLHIYGAYPKPHHLGLTQKKDRFFVHGFVEDINEKVRNARLMIAPISFGAGQKGKLLTAMENGTPSVTTSLGAEAMQFGRSWPGAISDNWQDFITKTQVLYNFKEQWQLAQSHISPLLEAHFNKQTYYDIFKRSIDILLLDIDSHRSKNVVGAILEYHAYKSSKYMSLWIKEKNQSEKSDAI